MTIVRRAQRWQSPSFRPSLIEVEAWAFVGATRGWTNGDQAWQTDVLQIPPPLVLRSSFCGARRVHSGGRAHEHGDTEQSWAMWRAGCPTTHVRAANITELGR